MKKNERRFDFLKEEKWSKLSKQDFKNLMSYKGTYSHLVRSERKIEEYERKISDLKDKINEYHDTLSDKNHFIDHLRDMYYFGISVVKVGGKYFNMSINRRGRTPKNISLGREEVIVDHLIKYYKGRRSKLKEIRSDWKGFLKSDQELYDRILDMILEDNEKFQGKTINRKNLFPLDTSKSTD